MSIIKDFARLTEEALDALMEAMEVKEAQEAIVEETTEGCYIVFTQEAMYYVSGGHVSRRPFAGPAESMMGL